MTKKALQCVSRPALTLTCAKVGNRTIGPPTLGLRIAQTICVIYNMLLALLLFRDLPRLIGHVVTSSLGRGGIES